MSEQDQLRNWRNIIWREWRYTEDKEFAQHLFDLVADEPVGWRVTTILVLLGAAYGTLGGLLIGLLLGLITVSTNASILILAITLLACPLIGGVLGGTAGFLVRKLLGRHLSWRRWLGWLAPKLTLWAWEKRLKSANSGNPGYETGAAIARIYGMDGSLSVKTTLMDA
jgi:hypothetical protein